MKTPEELAPLVRETVRAVDTNINELLLCSRAGFQYERTLLALTSKSIRLAEAACLLAEHSFYGEAFGLARSALDAFLRIKFISNRDREERARSFVDFFKAHLANQEEIRKAFFPDFDLPDEEKKRWIDDAKSFPSPKQWESSYNMAYELYLDPRERDERTGRQYDARFDYVGVYEDTSHFVHVNSIGLLAHYESPGSFYQTNPSPENDRPKAILAMYYCLIYLFQSCIVTLRLWETQLADTTQEKLNETLLILQGALPSHRIRMKRVLAKD
jgi:hypothetical protein